VTVAALHSSDHARRRKFRRRQNFTAIAASHLPRATAVISVAAAAASIFYRSAHNNVSLGQSANGAERERTIIRSLRAGSTDGRTPQRPSSKNGTEPVDRPDALCTTSHV